MEEYTLENLKKAFDNHIDKFTQDAVPSLEESYNLPLVLKVIIDELLALKKQA